MSRRGSREMRSLTWGEAGGACQSVGVVGVVGRSLRFASPRDSYLRGALRGAASRLHPRHTGLRAHPFLFPPPPRVITETGYRRGTCGEVLLTLSPSKSWHIQKHRRNPSRRPITLVRGDAGGNTYARAEAKPRRRRRRPSNERSNDSVLKRSKPSKFLDLKTFSRQRFRHFRFK